VSEIRNTLKKYKNGLLNRLPECIDNPQVNTCNVSIVEEPVVRPEINGLDIQLYLARTDDIIYPLGALDYRQFYIGVAIFFQTWCESVYTRSWAADFILEVSDCVRDLMLYANLVELLCLPHQAGETGIQVVEENGKRVGMKQLVFICKSYPRYFAYTIGKGGFAPLDYTKGDVDDRSSSSSSSKSSESGSMTSSSSSDVDLSSSSSSSSTSSTSTSSTSSSSSSPSSDSESSNLSSSSSSPSSDSESSNLSSSSSSFSSDSDSSNFSSSSSSFSSDSESSNLSSSSSSFSSSSSSSSST